MCTHDAMEHTYDIMISAKLDFQFVDLVLEIAPGTEKSRGVYSS